MLPEKKHNTKQFLTFILIYICIGESNFNLESGILAELDT